MSRIQTGRSLGIVRWNLKKIIILASFLGIGLIIINIDKLFRRHNCGMKTRDDETEQELWMDIMDARMERRRKKLEENCKFFSLHVRGNDSLHRPNAWEFLINRPFHLIWCNVFKAASTSWMYNFNILAGYKAEFLQKTKEVPLQLARNKYPRPTLQNLNNALNDSTSFLIPGKLSVFDYFKRSHTRPTFSEFVQYLLDLHKSGKPLDMHWTPINTFCTPCQIRFDIILKFGTLKEDQSYLIKKSNLESWIKSQWKNPTKGKKVTSKYFSQLNATQIYHLYKIYMYDFHLFDYNLEEYLKYVNFEEDDPVLKKLKLLYDSNNSHNKQY